MAQSLDTIATLRLDRALREAKSLAQDSILRTLSGVTRSSLAAAKAHIVSMQDELRTVAPSSLLSRARIADGYMAEAIHSAAPEERSRLVKLRGLIEEMAGELFAARDAAIIRRTPHLRIVA